jgi:hypothetical protein
VYTAARLVSWIGHGKVKPAIPPKTSSQLLGRGHRSGRVSRLRREQSRPNGRHGCDGKSGTTGDCLLINADGSGNGSFENVSLGATDDRKIVSALWAQTLTATTTVDLDCEITSGSVDADESSIAAIKVGTLH